MNLPHHCHGNDAFNISRRTRCIAFLGVPFNCDVNSLFIPAIGNHLGLVEEFMIGAVSRAAMHKLLGRVRIGVDIAKEAHYPFDANRNERKCLTGENMPKSVIEQIEQFRHPLILTRIVRAVAVENSAASSDAGVHGFTRAGVKLKRGLSVNELTQFPQIVNHRWNLNMLKTVSHRLLQANVSLAQHYHEEPPITRAARFTCGESRQNWAQEKVLANVQPFRNAIGQVPVADRCGRPMPLAANRTINEHRQAQFAMTPEITILAEQPYRFNVISRDWASNPRLHQQFLCSAEKMAISNEILANLLARTVRRHVKRDSRKPIASNVRASLHKPLKIVSMPQCDHRMTVGLPAARKALALWMILTGRWRFIESAMRDIGFHNRSDAGVALATLLGHYRGRDVLVLALPRGGVPVAKQIADALDAPLEVLLVRKLGVPGQEELAMGAIASVAGQTAMVLNEEIVAALGLSREIIETVAEHEQMELERRHRLYHNGEVEIGGVAEVRGRILIVVDDGLATGATMRAAVAALRRLEPARVVVAVPVAPPESVQALSADVDEVICPLTPKQFGGVGLWYEDFSQVTDDQVRETLLRVGR